MGQATTRRTSSGSEGQSTKEAVAATAGVVAETAKQEVMDVKDQAGERVDDGEENHVAAAGRKVLPALGQRLAEVGHRDPAHRGPVGGGGHARPTHRLRGLSDRRTGGAQLVHAPFDGISDVVALYHARSLRRVIR